MLGATTVWLTIAGSAAATVVMKASGPAMLGRRSLPRPALQVIAFLGPALLAAMAATNTFVSGRDLTVSASAVGVAAAAVVVWRGGSVLLAVIAAAALTALLRLVT